MVVFHRIEKAPINTREEVILLSKWKGYFIKFIQDFTLPTPPKIIIS